MKTHSVRPRIRVIDADGTIVIGPGKADLLEVLEIGHTLDRGVALLSGGERKRVALARALMSDPSILLLDEPLAGVDRDLRDRVLRHLVRVRDELAIPVVYVTHEQERAGASV